MTSFAPNARVGIVLTVMATMCWGLATVLSKLAVSTTSNGTLLFFHQLLSATIVCGLFASRRIRWGNKELRFAWLGFLEPGLAYALGLYGLTSATAIQAVIIQATEGFMIIGVAFLLFRKRTPIRVLAYGCAAIVGVILVCTPSGTLSSDISVSADWGVVWIALGTLAAAFYVSFTSSLVDDDCDPVLLIFWQLVTATATVAMLALFSGQGSELSSIPSPLAIVSGVVTYFLSFALYIYGMRSVPLHTSAFLLNLTPLFGVIFSLVILGESLTYLSGAGFGIIVASSILLSRSVSHD